MLKWFMAIFYTACALGTLVFTARAAPGGGTQGVSFRPYEVLSTGSLVEAAATGDLNHDGRTDVAIATTFYSDPENDYKILVFLQDSAGHLVLSAKYAADTGNSLAIADVNHDGLDDVVTTTSSGLGVLLQNRNGRLNALQIYPDYNANVRVATGDFNHDGMTDVAAISWGSGQVSVFLQKRDGTLSPAAHYNATHTGYEDFKVGDVNGDGLDDIVVMSGQSFAGFEVLTQRAGGGFDVSGYADGISGRSIAIGDLNGDGLNDVALSVVFTWDGYFGFVRYEVNAEGALNNGGISGDFPADTMKFSDMNGDGRPDLVSVGRGTLRIAPNIAGMGIPEYGSEIQVLKLPLAWPVGPHSLAIGDVNGDGAPDVVIANLTNALVLLNDPRSGVTPGTVPPGKHSDRLKPLIEVFGRPTRSTIHDKVLIGGRVTDNVKVATLEIKASGKGFKKIPQKGYWATTVALKVGKNIFTIRATDAQGNRTIKRIVCTRVIDDSRA